MPAVRLAVPPRLKGDADSTREKRIATVAWRWNRQYRYDAEYKARGFSDEEIREGDALGLAMSEEYYANRCYYGDPAYGSWPASAVQPIKEKIQAMLRGAPEFAAVLPVPISAPAVVTSPASHITARTAKVRTLAGVLHRFGVSASDASLLSPEQWAQLHAALKADRFLGHHSTPPSRETIALAVFELLRLERTIPICGAQVPHSPEAA